MYTCIRMYTLKREKAFPLPRAPPGCPGAAEEEDQRHYSAIKLLFAGVTLSGVCVDRGESALKVHSYIHTHTHNSFKQGC